MNEQQYMELNTDEINTPETSSNSKVECFSHENFAPQDKRLELENKYFNISVETEIFNRRLVSYQANKNQSLHNWIKYREGYSTDLVEILLNEFEVKEGETVLDPFLGSGTTSLTAKINNINSIGMDILPISHLAIKAKSNVYSYKIEELEHLFNELLNTVPAKVNRKINELKITEGAYPTENENDLLFFTQWNSNSTFSNESKLLIHLILTSILEDISYTRKDGQYLRWDYRSEKVIESNKKRLSQGKEPIKTVLDKGSIPKVKDLLLDALREIINDIRILQKEGVANEASSLLIEESALFALPKIENESFNAVITSPPYCNRYDYTRTYALELAYLNVSEQIIRELRQAQLSCTVENKSKLNQLREHYKTIDCEERFNKILEIISSNEVLKEIDNALKLRADNGEVNNKGILSMVEGYFTELTFIFFEIYRTLKPGSKVAFVNDNVRYAGEVIPVDYISTYIAEKIGFIPEKIYVLKQQKGNSSQQMKKYGRVPLRKSITIWKKPE
ncbi:cytosine-specific methyltransferase BsoBI [Lysinibacillus fusiformis ZB2]|nr:cytosine-specific methyltransferase BsoBI [Lysinibacillus fusiformis ZB2]